MKTMNNILDQEFKQPKEVFTKAQEKALQLIEEKEEKIRKTQEEITKILNENDLNAFDVDKYKRDQIVQKFPK